MAEEEKPPRLPQIVTVYAMSKEEEAISDTHNWKGGTLMAFCEDCGVCSEDEVSWTVPCPGKKDRQEQG